MICPRCKKYQDVLTFEPMKHIEEFDEQTVQILKCSLCHWVFAPKPDQLPDEVEQMIDELRMGVAA